MKADVAQGKGLGLILCLDCQKISHQGVDTCSRCGGRISQRKPDSLVRCWALSLTGLILYIPANLLPIMTVSQWGDGKPETIMSGVMTLIEKNMLTIAALVFLASIVVPLFKLVVMFWLLLSIKMGSVVTRNQVRLYRLIVWIGRWSMLDIFIISLLTGLVQYGQLGTVTAGPAAYAFACVVVVTMWAAKSFDPRLLWDATASESSDPEQNQLSENNHFSVREPEHG